MRLSLLLTSFVALLFATACAAATEPKSASDLLLEAHEARAIWDDFPGFTADICVNVDGKSQCGQVAVDAYGKVELHGIELDGKAGVLRTLQSLINHRFSGGEFNDEVSFADDNKEHPLGRLITLDHDSRMASSYRVKDDMICQVNRMMGNSRFTISVFSVHRNKENKILPQSYNVCFWNEDSTLRNSITVHEAWTRVGEFDLPTTHTSVNAGKDSLTNVRIEFSNHKLNTRASK